MTAPQRELIDDCVHCGFCLPHCPTYLNWGEEMDSPRGRIDLMRGLRTGQMPMTPTVVAHFDRCLGCMACVTACPSGVRYDVLIEETRAYVERKYRRGFWDRLHRWMIFQVFPYPRRLRAMAAFLLVYVWTGMRWLVRHTGVLKLVPSRMRQLEELQPPVTLRSVFSQLPARVPAAGERRMRVALVAGCVQRIFNPGVNDATIRVLAAEGCDVIVPAGQGCCGALSMHAGREEESLRFARDLIERFSREPVDAVVINAAGCGSHLKDYARLFPDDARAREFAAKVRDVNELLAALPPRAPRRPLQLRVAMHDACHLVHAQRIKAQPRKLLGAIPGLTLVEVPDSEQCCGSAGIYNLVQPQSAEQIGQRKVDNVLSTRAELLASANPGCTLQIQKILRERGKRLPAAHPIEILDASISGTPLPS
ncbi:MAG: 4Fe-4S dicluster domain-containing protein [Deltaproteobacteria bacterium]|nr:MAG: 4Fe-4S dicluster domain-containing protein [Deltaproteobacteria bacterium]